MPKPEVIEGVGQRIQRSTELQARVEVERKLAESRNTAAKLANERDSWRLAAERNLNNVRDIQAELTQARNLAKQLEKAAGEAER